MSDFKILGFQRLPGRLTAGEVAALTGFQTVHITILMNGGLLKPLGSPPPNAPKYFSRDKVLALASDERWLARASDFLVRHWAKKNQGGTSIANRSTRRPIIRQLDGEEEV